MGGLSWNSNLPVSILVDIPLTPEKQQLTDGVCLINRAKAPLYNVNFVTYLWAEPIRNYLLSSHTDDDLKNEATKTVETSEFNKICYNAPSLGKIR